MGSWKNVFDISGEFGVKGLKAVNREVARTLAGVYDHDAMVQFDQPFADFPSPYFGENRYFLPCDTYAA